MYVYMSGCIHWCGHGKIYLCEAGNYGVDLGYIIISVVLLC
jgi:hypothetical protein